jgi:hypothetical protein
MAVVGSPFSPLVKPEVYSVPLSEGQDVVMVGVVAGGVVPAPVVEELAVELAVEELAKRLDAAVEVDGSLEAAAAVGLEAAVSAVLPLLGFSDIHQRGRSRVGALVLRGQHAADGAPDGGGDDDEPDGGDEEPEARRPEPANEGFGRRCGRRWDTHPERAAISAAARLGISREGAAVAPLRGLKERVIADGRR